MRIADRHSWGPVEALEVGCAPVGRPWMTVYLYRIGETLFDTGLPHMRREVLDFARQGPGVVRRVMLTHHHEDHSGNAGAFSRRLGVPVLGHALACERMRTLFSMLPYRHYAWGRPDAVDMAVVPEVVDGDQGPIAAIPTPGHSADHMVYFLPDLGLLLSGDLYLGDYIKYFRPNEQIEQQIRSIEKVLQLDFDGLLCGHHPRLGGGKSHLRNKLQFLEDFLGRVTEAVNEGCSEQEIVARMGLVEVRLVRWITFGDASMKNMVRSAVRAAKESTGVVSEGAPERASRS